MKKIAGVLLATLLLFCQSVFADQPTTVLTEVKNGKHVTLEIPVIDGANDEVFQRSANHILRNAAEDVADKVGKKGNVTYEVTMNRPSLVSVLLKGTNGGRLYYRGVNLDLTTGREFTLDDFFFSNEERENCWANIRKTYCLRMRGLSLLRKKALNLRGGYPMRNCCPWLESVISVGC